MFKNIKKLLLRFRQKHLKRFTAFFFFSLLLFLFPSPNIYFKQAGKNTGLFLPEEFNLPKPPPIPVNQTGVLPPSLSAGAVLVIDIPSNMVIYGKNERQRFFPASTTKIVTALVGLDHFLLDDVLTVKTVIKEGRIMGLISGEELSFESLLYGALVHSANDAAFAIAENYPGGIEKFVSAMNKKADLLYLENTHFTNPIGFDNEENYTTASDLAKIAKVALSNKVFTKIVSTKSITVSDMTYTNFHELKNVNELLGKVAGMSGVKTGFTQTAGEILVSKIERNGREVLFVVLKSSDRFGETKKLISWVFGNIIWKEFSPATPLQ